MNNTFLFLFSVFSFLLLGSTLETQFTSSEELVIFLEDNSFHNYSMFDDRYINVSNYKTTQQYYDGYVSNIITRTIEGFINVMFDFSKLMFLIGFENPHKNLYMIAMIICLILFSYVYIMFIIVLLIILIKYLHKKIKKCVEDYKNENRR